MTTFPIGKAASNLVNRLTLVAMLAIITFVIFTIIDIRSILPILLLVPLVLLLTYAVLANKFTVFAVDDEKLRIKRTMYGRNIDKSSLDLVNAKIINLSEDANKGFRPVLRTNGIGLPFYQAGWFRLHHKEKALLFVTNNKSVVYIPTSEGYALILSVDDPVGFLRSLKL